MVKTVIALFDEMSVAQRAVQELVDRGFNRDQISVMASNRAATHADADVAVDTAVETADGAATGAGIGAVLGGMAGLLVGIGALAIPGIGPIIAAGPLAAALAGAGLGAATGGVIGALADSGVPEDQAEYYAEGVRRGGVLVTVKTDDGTEDQAIDILNSYGPVDIDRRVSDWRETGWAGYDGDSDENYPVDDGFPTSGGTATAGSQATDGGTGYVETNQMGTGSGRNGEGSGVVGSGAGYSGSTKVTQNRETFGSRGSDLGTGGGSYTGTSGVIDTENRGTAGGSFTPSTDRTSYGTGTGGTAEGGSGVGRYTSNQGMSTSGSYPGIRQGEMGASHRRFEDYEDDFRRDYEERFTDAGTTYDSYMPAYRFGYDLGLDDRYRGLSWEGVRTSLSNDWGTNHPNSAWSEVEAAVEYGWNRVREGVRDVINSDR